MILLSILTGSILLLILRLHVLLLLCKVTELSPEETESVTGGYGKSISHVIIGLKTVKGTKQLKLDPTIYDALIKEKVRPLVYYAFLIFNEVVFILKLCDDLIDLRL